MGRCPWMNDVDVSIFTNFFHALPNLGSCKDPDGTFNVAIISGRRPLPALCAIVAVKLPLQPPFNSKNIRSYICSSNFPKSPAQLCSACGHVEQIFPPCDF